MRGCITSGRRAGYCLPEGKASVDDRRKCWAAGVRAYRLIDYVGMHLGIQSDVLAGKTEIRDPYKLQDYLRFQHDVVERVASYVDETIREASACGGTGGRGERSWDKRWEEERVRIVAVPSTPSEAFDRINRLNGVRERIERRELDIGSPPGVPAFYEQYRGGRR